MKVWCAYCMLPRPLDKEERRELEAEGILLCRCWRVWYGYRPRTPRRVR